jgi:anti-anti-sigma factor
MVGQLRFDFTPEGPDRIRIAVAGEVDLATANELSDCLRGHADRDVVLDLSEVGFLDSSGISALVQGYHALRDGGRTLRVVGERENVRRVLEVAGVLEIFRGSADQ